MKANREPSKNPPHPATSTLPRATTRSPHPATVAQPKTIFKALTTRSEHAATLLRGNSSRPHAAATAQTPRAARASASIQRAALAQPAFALGAAAPGTHAVKIHKIVVAMLMNDLGKVTPEGFVETGSLQSFGLNYTANVLDYHISFQYNSSGWCEKLHYAVRDIRPGARKNDVLYWWYELFTTNAGVLSIGFTGTAGDGSLATISTAGTAAGCPVGQWTDINAAILAQIDLYKDTYRSVELVNSATYGWQLSKKSKK